MEQKVMDEIYRRVSAIFKKNWFISSDRISVELALTEYEKYLKEKKKRKVL